MNELQMNNSKQLWNKCTKKHFEAVVTGWVRMKWCSKSILWEIQLWLHQCFPLATVPLLSNNHTSLLKNRFRKAMLTQFPSSWLMVRMTVLRDGCWKINQVCLRIYLKINKFLILEPSKQWMKDLTIFASCMWSMGVA